jgi:hypothetical protein
MEEDLRRYEAGPLLTPAHLQKRAGPPVKPFPCRQRHTYYNKQGRPAVSPTSCEVGDALTCFL